MFASGTALTSKTLAVVITVPVVLVITTTAFVIFYILRRFKPRRAAMSNPNEGAVQPFLVSNNGTAPPPYCKVDVARHTTRDRDNEIATVPVNDEKTDPRTV